MNRPIRSLFSILLLCLFASSALADGMIVPIDRSPSGRSGTIRPIPLRGSWAVTHHNVTISVVDQVASVSVDQEFINTGAGMMEVEYLFPVPPDAAIDGMTLLVNGQEYTAQLYKADEARQIYESIVRTKRDPALLEYAGFGLYRTKAFPLMPNQPAKVIVNYKNVCKNNGGLVEVWYPLNTEKFSSKPIEDVSVRVDVTSRADITAVYSPSHELNIDRKDARHLVATYHATKTTPATDFQMFYRSADEAVGATLLTHQPSADRDGYFLLLVSPNARSARDSVIAKDIIVALDRSGSMSGEKIQQAKEALRSILRNLNSEDRFNILTYNDANDTFFDRLVAADKPNIAKAESMVDRIEAGGATNIYDAVAKSLSLFEAGKRPAYLFFLTDGQPTVGKTNMADILSHATETNKTNVRVFCFGIGYDVNVRLLDKLCGDNHGRSDYVKQNEPIENKISSLYNKVRNPVMTDLAMKINGVQFKDNYPRQLDDLFEGDQIVVAGRYDPSAAGARDPQGQARATLVITGKYQGGDKSFEYPVTVNPPGRDLRFAFVEKVWAMRRIGFLLDQIQLNGSSNELIDEVVRLSRDYGIMTPYTSFLADERGVRGLNDVPAMRAAGRRGAAGFGATGVGGQMDATNRQQLNQAGAGRGGGGFGGGAGGRGGVAVVGKADQASYELQKATVMTSVRTFGNQAVYQRGQQWIAANAADVDIEKDVAKIKSIERFTKEYFDLIATNTTEENQILASQGENEQLLIKLRGQVYNIR